MKKKTLTTLCILAFTAAVFPFAASGFAANTNAAAETQAPTETLIAPQTYEEYLPLSAPTDVAVSENYTAIADGNDVYVYDRQDGAYRKYTHGESDAKENDVTKLQFDEYGTLYFLDNSISANFYALNVETGDEVRLDVACGTFTVHGNDLYFTNAQKELFSASISDSTLSSARPLQWSGVSSLAFWNGELYFIHADYYLTKIDPKSQTEPDANKAHLATFPKQIARIAIDEGILACTSTAGELYAYALPHADEENLLFRSKQEGFTAVTAFGGFLYVVDKEDASILQYSTEENAFTGFEISAASHSLRRLNGAVETYLTGDKLFIADNGNARVSVFNRKTNAFETPVACTLAPSFLSADEKTLLIANGEKAVLYDLTEEAYGEEIKQYALFNGKLVGAANVYGTYYLLTENNYCYTLKQENGEWRLTETKKTSTRYPKALTSDVYGNLYVLSGGDVYRFTEEQFISTSETGEKTCEGIHPATTKIAVDYNGTVYALAESTLYLCGGKSFAFDEPLVYYVDESATPTILSFAIGIEENETYLLCEGNYLVVSTALNLPTVKTIAVNGADEKIFEDEAAEFTVVKTEQNALLVEFDLQALQGAEYFPYLSFERSEAQRTMLKIGETQTYCLLAEYDESAETYRTYLALANSCSTLPADDYRTQYGDAQQKTGYVTNAITLYKFPYLTELLRVDTLPRGAEVTLLGEIDELDHAYFHVSFLSENGEIQTGYVPQAFVTEFSGLPLQSETVEAGETESDTDSVFRLVYLLLGFAAICILTDYLLLRKKKGGRDYE